MGDLRDQLLSFPEAWRPAVGETLIGNIVEIVERDGFAGDRYPMVTVHTGEGQEVVFHAYHTVAKSELARLEPKVGETIGIACHGRHPEKDYIRYRIKVVRDEAPVDWQGIGARAEAELATVPDHDVAGDADDDIPF